MPLLKCVDERSAIFAVIRAKDWRQVNGGFLTFPPLTEDHNHHLSHVGQKKVEYLKKNCALILLHLFDVQCKQDII